jgi:sulfonate transport system permease protein
MPRDDVLGTAKAMQSRAAAPPRRLGPLGLDLAWRGLPWLLPFVLLVAWEFGARAGWTSPQIFPAPGDVVSGFWQVSQTGELWNDMAVSTLRALSGLAVGGGIGFVLGILNGVSPLSARLTDTTLQMVRNIPILALIPLAILWFGIGEGAKIFLIAVGVFFVSIR